MSLAPWNAKELAALRALANGIIPADATDEGVSGVHSISRLSAQAQTGVHAALYRDGVTCALAVAREKFGRDLDCLAGPEVHELLAVIRAQRPGFFKQLRMDVSALYLSDPEVWRRIGFPGPSTAAGGYPDFDQPQS